MKEREHLLIMPPPYGMGHKAMLLSVCLSVPFARWLHGMPASNYHRRGGNIVSPRDTLLSWAEEVGGQERPAPSNTSVGAIHVFGPSWKMLNQPPVSPLSMAMTENY